ncbi:hypothetical protein JCM39194_23550 [Desulfotomaculum varum]
MPQKETLQEIPLANYTGWIERLKKGEVLSSENIELIPDEKIKEILRSQEIKSILILPVHLEEELYGFIGFDECLNNRQWCEADIELLQVAARIIAQK